MRRRCRNAIYINEHTLWIVYDHSHGMCVLKCHVPPLPIDIRNQSWIHVYHQSCASANPSSANPSKYTLDHRADFNRLDMHSKCEPVPLPIDFGIPPDCTRGTALQFRSSQLVCTAVRRVPCPPKIHTYARNSKARQRQRAVFHRPTILTCLLILHTSFSQPSTAAFPSSLPSFFLLRSFTL